MDYKSLQVLHVWKDLSLMRIKSKLVIVKFDRLLNCAIGPTEGRLVCVLLCSVASTLTDNECGIWQSSQREVKWSWSVAGKNKDLQPGHHKLSGSILHKRCFFKRLPTAYHSASQNHGSLNGSMSKKSGPQQNNYYGEYSPQILGHPME